MTASFLDTTIVMGMAQKSSPTMSERCETFARANRPAEVAHYAWREVLAGPISYICRTHNIVLSSNNAGEALVAIVNKAGAGLHRAESIGIRRIGEILHRAFSGGASISGQDSRRELLQSLMLDAATLWISARRQELTTGVQPLACFRPGELDIGEGGELRGPRGTFGCDRKERCSAAGYMFDDEVALANMIEALDPRNLDEGLRDKQELKTRRKALKELARLGPKDFDKRRCRSLGDAYFATMCPRASTLATTNTVDFAPLCTALGKKLAAV